MDLCDLCFFNVTYSISICCRENYFWVAEKSPQFADAIYSMTFMSHLAGFKLCFSFFFNLSLSAISLEKSVGMMPG